MIVIRRPFVWMLGTLILLFLLYRAINSERDDARYYIFQGIWEEETSSAVTGEVERILLRQKEEETGASIYLKNCRLRIAESGEEEYFLKRLLVYCDGQPGLEPGNQLSVSGCLREMSQASNPGQFDQRAYYKEKGIYYQLQAREVFVTSKHRIWWKSALYHLRDRMGAVYEQCLPQREGGVVTAMILGDKSLLDMDIKKLYQESGIGHLLAISGLHVTILGMACCRLLRCLGMPVGGAVLSAVVVVLSYGCMTDFSISTSRAVIMMVLLLMAEWIGRTYDRKNALAFSAVVILLQKPFALFSCSFLLSFGAVAGMELLLPVLRFLVYGDEEDVRERRRREGRRNRELRANCRMGGVLVQMFSLREKAVSMFLASLSVQLMTVPVVLYFFYEIPVYGIFINLLVIPLASFVVLLSFLGGLWGCVCLPLGKLLLGTVYYLLCFYEAVCGLFRKLPGHMQILGCPAAWKIIVYYGVLFLMCGAVWYRKSESRLCFSRRSVTKDRREKARRRRFVPWVLAGICCPVLLFVPVPVGHFQMTMLDVGQGDSIFLHANTGQNILVDGGSTSISGAGNYRILPFLKYSGVRRLDYVVMTHSDEDHMNGLLTVLEESGRSGPVVKRLVIPDVAAGQEDGRLKILSVAREKKIPVAFLSEGYVLRSGGLSITCLNPAKDFAAESANAGSIALSLRYKSFSCLLTGDLEGDGEEHVKEILERGGQNYRLPASYTVLKVAHHGSKNSTDEDFLRLVSPRLSLISCGRKNRYGHPHRELLERLYDVDSQVYATPEHGAVSVESDGNALRIKTYLRGNGNYMKKSNDK